MNCSDAVNPTLLHLMPVHITVLTLHDAAVLLSQLFRFRLSVSFIYIVCNHNNLSNILLPEIWMRKLISK